MRNLNLVVPIVANNPDNFTTRSSSKTVNIASETSVPSSRPHRQTEKHSRLFPPYERRTRPRVFTCRRKTWPVSRSLFIIPFSRSFCLPRRFYFFLLHQRVCVCVCVCTERPAAGSRHGRRKSPGLSTTLPGRGAPSSGRPRCRAALLFTRGPGGGAAQAGGTGGKKVNGDKAS